jgi:hypothetical protein
MELEGDRGRTVLAMVVARAWRDEEYKRRFLSDPKGVLAEEGVEIPDDVELRVLEDTPTAKYINVSRHGEEAEPQKIGQVLERLLPVPEGHELRLVQSTDKTRYLVMPQLPTAADPSKLSEPELMRLAADSGVQSVYHDTSEAVEAETTEVTVTETTEVQDVETSTTVVAEAELVAT